MHNNRPRQHNYANTQTLTKTNKTASTMRSIG